MKNLFILIALFITTAVKAQEVKLLPEIDGLVEYQGVEEVPNKSKSQLYTQSKIFFTKAFKSAKNVIDLDDSENGTIMGKGSFKIYAKSVGFTHEQVVRFSIKVDSRDGKYRYTINGFNSDMHNIDQLNGYVTGKIKNMKNTKKYASQQIEGIDREIQLLIALLKKEMSDTDDF